MLPPGDTVSALIRVVLYFWESGIYFGLMDAMIFSLSTSKKCIFCPLTSNVLLSGRNNFGLPIFFFFIVLTTLLCCISHIYIFDPYLPTARYLPSGENTVRKLFSSCRGSFCTTVSIFASYSFATFPLIMKFFIPCRNAAPSGSYRRVSMVLILLTRSKALSRSFLPYLCSTIGPSRIKLTVLFSSMLQALCSCLYTK